MEEYVWISKFINHPFFENYTYPVLRHIAKEYNIKISIDGSTDDSNKDYTNAVFNAIKNKVSGIMIVGWADKDIVAAVNKAMKRGIPVISVDSDIAKSMRLAYVGTNWYDMGKTMAETIAGLLHESGKVLMLGMAGFHNISLGYRGFSNQIKSYPGIQLLGPEEDINMQSDKAEAIVSRYLKKYPDLSGVVAFDSDSGIGAACALKKILKMKTVKLITVDTDKPHLDYIEDETISAVFVQRRSYFTYLAFQMLYSYNHGSVVTGFRPGLMNIPGNIDTGHILVTKKNVNDYYGKFDIAEAIDRHQLSQQINLFLNMVENVKEIIIATDVYGQVIYANPGACGIFGFDKETIRKYSISNLFKLSEKQYEQVIACAEEKGHCYFETSAVAKAGFLCPVKMSCSSLLADDSIRGLVIVAADNREYKKIEDDIKWQLTLNSELSALSEELNKPQSDMQHIAISVLDTAKRITNSEHGYVSRIDPENNNRVVLTFTKMMLNQCKVNDKKIIFPIGKDGQYPALWGHCLNAKNGFYTNNPPAHEKSTKTPAGHIALRNFLSVPVQIGGVLFGQIALANCSEGYQERDLAAIERLAQLYAFVLQRISMNENLIKEKNRAHNYLDIAAVMLVALDKDGTVALMNKKGCEIFESTEKEVVGKNWFDNFLPEEDRMQTKAVFEQIMLGHIDRFEYHENYIVDYKGRKKLIAWHNTVVKNDEGEIIGTLSSGSDISEQRAWQINLENMAKFPAEDPSPVMRINKEGVLLFANKSSQPFWEEWGLRLEQEVSPYLKNIVEDVIKIGEKRNVEIKGGDRIFLFSFMPIVEQQYVNLYGSDVTEQIKAIITKTVAEVEKGKAEEELKKAYDELKLIQAQLIKAEKLSAMGVLAAGVVHELNSPLSGIMNLLKIHKNNAVDGTEYYQELTLMIEAAENMSKIIKDLNSFSRDSKGESSVLDLNEVIKSTIKFSKHLLIKKSISLNMILEDSLKKIKADRSQLQQVFLNIITNACDAMSEGGIFEVSTNNSADSQNSEIRFKDNGSGIEEQNLSLIFDPFFSTKGHGKGVRLGLSISKGIIEQHGGSISVESKAGLGTTFTIILPAIE